MHGEEERGDFAEMRIVNIRKNKRESIADEEMIPMKRETLLEGVFAMRKRNKK